MTTEDLLVDTLTRVLEKAEAKTKLSEAEETLAKSGFDLITSEAEKSQVDPAGMLKALCKVLAMKIVVQSKDLGSIPRVLKYCTDRVQTEVALIGLTRAVLEDEKAQTSQH